MLETYIIEIERGLSEAEYNRLLLMADIKKRQRILQFRRFEDAERALLADILIRLLINEKLSIPNSKIHFQTNQYGKPYLSGTAGFHFNVSHSGKYVACVIDSLQVGIDVEEIRVADITIAEKFFTKNETEYIMKFENQDRLKAFIKIWTMKEAYVKYCGAGLSLPLNSFDVLLMPDISYCCIIENDTAICHVCTKQPCISTPVFLNIDHIMDKLYVSGI